ncbi:hypothetical protein [Sphingomonas sp. KR3-1]|uniref:hypothetical protein n=1 Tax=Sphingomonas sp. KR3-1 TaxID=3156611 RepID=UPI0032B4701D
MSDKQTRALTVALWAIAVNLSVLSLSALTAPASPPGTGRASPAEDPMRCDRDSCWIRVPR